MRFSYKSTICFNHFSFPSQLPCSATCSWRNLDWCGPVKAAILLRVDGCLTPVVSGRQYFCSNATGCPAFTTSCPHLQCSLSLGYRDCVMEVPCSDRYSSVICNTLTWCGSVVASVCCRKGLPWGGVSAVLTCGCQRECLESSWIQY